MTFKAQGVKVWPYTMMTSLNELPFYSYLPPASEVAAR